KLNTDTKIEVDYRETMRRVQLLKGEAVFNVAHNPDRPFVVYSGETTAEAIGTSFIVRLREQVTELSVIEGVVSFAKIVQAAKPKIGAVKPAQGREEPEGPQREAQAILLKAGQALTSAQIPAELSAAETVPVALIAPRELQRKLSWTDGVFDFSDTPLQEVVDEINRYSPVQVEIVDADLRAMKFGGIFETSDPEALLEALEELGVRVERAGDDRILLHSRQSR
ncbi:MAG: FecR domain-containing protein, partial [Amphiplicatus sp.]